MRQWWDHDLQGEMKLFKRGKAVHLQYTFYILNSFQDSYNPISNFQFEYTSVIKTLTCFQLSHKCEEVVSFGFQILVQFAKHKKLWPE